MTFFLAVTSPEWVISLDLVLVRIGRSTRNSIQKFSVYLCNDDEKCLVPDDCVKGLAMRGWHYFVAGLFHQKASIRWQNYSNGSSDKNCVNLIGGPTAATLLGAASLSRVKFVRGRSSRGTLACGVLGYDIAKSLAS